MELELIEAERHEIYQLFRKGMLNDEARRYIERELDLRETQLFQPPIAECEAVKRVAALNICFCRRCLSRIPVIGSRRSNLTPLMPFSPFLHRLDE
jgi:hypothetical protein